MEQKSNHEYQCQNKNPAKDAVNEDKEDEECTNTQNDEHLARKG